MTSGDLSPVSLSGPHRQQEEHSRQPEEPPQPQIEEQLPGLPAWALPAPTPRPGTATARRQVGAGVTRRTLSPRQASGAPPRAQDSEDYPVLWVQHGMSDLQSLGPHVCPTLWLSLRPPRKCLSSQAEQGPKAGLLLEEDTYCEALSLWLGHGRMLPEESRPTQTPACVPLWGLLSQWPHTLAPCSLPGPSTLSGVLPGLDVLSQPTLDEGSSPHSQGVSRRAAMTAMSCVSTPPSTPRRKSSRQSRQPFRTRSEPSDWCQTRWPRRAASMG